MRKIVHALPSYIPSSHSPAISPLPFLPSIHPSIHSSRVSSSHSFIIFNPPLYFQFPFFSPFFLFSWLRFSVLPTSTHPFPRSFSILSLQSFLRLFSREILWWVATSSRGADWVDSTGYLDQEHLPGYGKAHGNRGNRAGEWYIDLVGSSEEGRRKERKVIRSRWATITFSFVRSFIHYLLVRAFIFSLIHSVVHNPVDVPICIHPIVNSFIQFFIFWLCKFFNDRFLLIHPFCNSLIHSVESTEEWRRVSETGRPTQRDRDKQK